MSCTVIFLSEQMMEQRAAGGEWLETATKHLGPRMYAQLCSAMCCKGKVVSKAFRLLGKAYFALRTKNLSVLSCFIVLGIPREAP